VEEEEEDAEDEEEEDDKEEEEEDVADACGRSPWYNKSPEQPSGRNVTAPLGKAF
jgi:hypothetical protein